MTVACTVQLQAGRIESGYVVRIQGRGTMRESQSVQEFAAACLESDGCRLFIDLRDCEYLDSTFLGCLVVLHKQFQTGDGDRFQVVASEQRCQDLFASMRLHTFFSITESAPQPGEMVDLACEADDETKLGRHVLECHRQLADMGGPQQAIFRSIVAQLERELDEKEQRQEHSSNP